MAHFVQTRSNQIIHQYVLADDRALGTPLEWPDARIQAAAVRAWGIEQLLAIWRRARGKERDALLWGDEIEYLVVNLDASLHEARLSLRQADILTALAEDEHLASHGGTSCVPAIHEVNSDPELPLKMRSEVDRPATIPVFHPEFGRFMLEATPGKPWGIGFRDLLDVEPNMKWR